MFNCLPLYLTSGRSTKLCAFWAPRNLQQLRLNFIVVPAPIIEQTLRPKHI